MSCKYNQPCPSSDTGQHCWHSTHVGAWYGIIPPPVRCCWCSQTQSTMAPSPWGTGTITWLVNNQGTTQCSSRHLLCERVTNRI